MSLDGHPILGPDPDSPALVYACGFSRNGILFAPWAAARLAELLVGDAGRRLEPFRVDRPSLSDSAPDLRRSIAASRNASAAFFHASE